MSAIPHVQPVQTAPLCPVCEGVIAISSDTEESEILTCEDCGSRIVVESVNPFTLSPAPEVEEDWGE